MVYRFEFSLQRYYFFLIYANFLDYIPKILLIFWIIFRKFVQFFGLEHWTGGGDTRYTCGRNRKTKQMAERQEIPEWDSGKGKKNYDAECNSLSNECLNTTFSTYTNRKGILIKLVRIKDYTRGDNSIN